MRDVDAATLVMRRDYERTFYLPVSRGHIRRTFHAPSLF